MLPQARGSRAGRRVARPESGGRYEVESLIGAGGFGQVYLARRLGASSTVPRTVCIKISPFIDGWLREAYFGQLLDGHPRAIRVFDRFARMLPEERPLYCLVLEYAKHGDLSAHLRRTGKGWREATARREIAGILEVLGKLHRGQLLHRDLTPMNVFVCDGPPEAGDFGIVRSASDRGGIPARTLNPAMVPSEMVAAGAPKWRARDDVYQVGQLLGMLVKGDARARIRTSEVRTLACSDSLKEIIHRCIGERRKRYESAGELIEALRKRPPSLRAGVLRSLRGAPRPSPALTKTRLDARRQTVGAVVHGGTFRPHHGGGARASQPAAGGGEGRRPQAHGDQAPAREGAAYHAAQREAVLEAGGKVGRGQALPTAVQSCPAGRRRWPR